MHSIRWLGLGVAEGWGLEGVSMGGRGGRGREVRERGGGGRGLRE